MVERVALLVSVSPTEDAEVATIRVSDVASDQPVPVGRLTFMLTMERELGADYARGHLRLVDHEESFPVQSNAALLDLLASLVEKEAG